MLDDGAAVVGVDVLLDASTKRLQQSIDAVHFSLELQREPDAAPRLLPFEVNALSIMTGAPRAGGLLAVAFDLSRLA